MPRHPKPILTPAQRAALSAIGKLGAEALNAKITRAQRREWSAKGGRAGKGKKKTRKAAGRFDHIQRHYFRDQGAITGKSSCLICGHSREFEKHIQPEGVGE